MAGILRTALAFSGKRKLFSQLQKRFTSHSEMNSPFPLGVARQFTFKKCASQEFKGKTLRAARVSPAGSVGSRRVCHWQTLTPQTPRQLKTSWTGQCCSVRRSRRAKRGVGKVFVHLFQKVAGVWGWSPQGLKRRRIQLCKRKSGALAA